MVTDGDDGTPWDFNLETKKEKDVEDEQEEEPPGNCGTTGMHSLPDIPEPQ